MSKKSKTKKVEVKALTQNEKKTIIIAAIALAMAIIITLILVLTLRPKDVINNPVDDGSNGSSTLTIKNGDFAYFDDETDVYPKTADNWTKRTWQKPESNKTHGFDEITTDEKVVAGVVPAESADGWKKIQSDLKKQGISKTVTFPDVHEDAVDKNIYMIATKTATTAAIFSQTFSIASQVSAKITVWINADQVTNGNAVVMFQNGSGTLKTDSDNWYAYNMGINSSEHSGWYAYEFYLFNRKSSSAIIVCSVGLGNCYSEEEEITAEGVLFIDDITFETVSANEYRKYHDADEDAKQQTNYFIIEGDTTTNEVEYFDWTKGWDEGPFDTEAYLNYAKVEDEAYSPFIKDEPFQIYRLYNDGTDKNEKQLELNQWNGSAITLQLSKDLKDHLHIGFWLRTVNENGNLYANIILQMKTASSDWEDVKNGSWMDVNTTQEIETDNNCGWVKYDIYIKPTNNETQVRLLITLGRLEGYEGKLDQYLPQGAIYASQPIVEKISASEYKNGTGSYSKQVNLVDGEQASFAINNGSFSNYTTSNADQPTNWTPVYAGENEIYRDGKGTVLAEGVEISKNRSVSYGEIVKYDGDEANQSPEDDVEKNVLAITNTKDNSYGYLSNKFTLSARNVYVVTFLAKVSGAGVNPYAYVVKDNPDNRENAYLGKIEKAANHSNLADDTNFGWIEVEAKQDTDWMRYYMIIITGDTSVSARLALFNGSIDGTEQQTGTVYYDMADYYSIGTYSVNIDEEDENADLALRDRIEFSAKSGYETFEKLSDDEIFGNSDEEIVGVAEYSNVVINYDAEKTEDFAENEWDWNSIVTEAMKEPEKAKDDTTTKTPTEKEPVNVALLVAALSSVALLGALLIVVVAKVFQKRNKGQSKPTSKTQK